MVCHDSGSITGRGTRIVFSTNDDDLETTAETTDTAIGDEARWER